MGEREAVQLRMRLVSIQDDRSVQVLRLQHSARFLREQVVARHVDLKRFGPHGFRRRCRRINGRRIDDDIDAPEAWNYTTGNPAILDVSALATVIQALLHGLGMQAAADPHAFDRQEVLTLCLDMLSLYMKIPRRTRKPRKSAANNLKALNGARYGRQRPRAGRLPKGLP